MAEAIGVTAGLLGIATFAYQLSKEVCDLVDSILKAPRTIRDLRSELIALEPILSSICKVVTNDEAKFEDIRYPLHQCGMVCYHLRTIIQQRTGRSGDGTIGARDWVKLQYRGKTIDGYKSQLAAYKATIGIALNLFTLYDILPLISLALLTLVTSRTNSALAVEAADEIKRAIQDAVSQTQPDLEVHIEEITEGLETLAVEASASNNSRHAQPDGTGRLQVLENKERTLEEDRLALEAERKAMKQSQLICTTASQRVEGEPAQLQPQSVHVVFSGANNSGFQIGQNMGSISNLKFGARP